jgi:hypothetical protein
MQCSLQAIAYGSAKQQTALIERLTAGQMNRDASLQAQLRLLIDEIVEDLSRTLSNVTTPRCQQRTETVKA